MIHSKRLVFKTSFPACVVISCLSVRILQLPLSAFPTSFQRNVVQEEHIRNTELTYSALFNRTTRISYAFEGLSMSRIAGFEFPEHPFMGASRFEDTCQLMNRD